MSFKPKRDINPNRLFKHKARLNIHGTQQEYSANFFETFSPVVTWFAIIMLLVLSIINGSRTRQMDFVLEFTQVHIECYMYM